MINVGSKSSFLKKAFDSGIVETLAGAIFSITLASVLTFYPEIAVSDKTQPILAKFAFSFAVITSIAIFFRIWRINNDREQSAKEHKEFLEEQFSLIASASDPKRIEAMLQGEMKRTGKELADLLSGISLVSLIGELSTTHDYLQANLPAAKEVWNLQISTQTKDDIDHHSESAERTAQLFADSVARGAIWHEVYSSKTVSRSARIRELIKEKRPDRLVRYAPRTIQKDVPTLNFIIISYESRPTEVLFGFSLHERSSLNNIFKSVDIRIVNHFKNYFDALTLPKYTAPIP